MGASEPVGCVIICAFFPTFFATTAQLALKHLPAHPSNLLCCYHVLVLLSRNANYTHIHRRSRAASAFVVNMMVPSGSDVMNLVMTFGSSKPWPVQISGSAGAAAEGCSGSNGDGSSRNAAVEPGSSSSSGDGGSSNGGGSSRSSSGFEHTLRRFLLADATERSNMFKMIPHIEVGVLWLFVVACVSVFVCVAKCSCACLC